MAEMDAFERQVADVARRIVGPPRRVDAMAVTKAARDARPAGLSRPRVTLLAAVRWRPALTAMLLTAIALAALVGSLIMTGGAPSTSPAPEDRSVSVLPAEIPASIPHGVIDTPIGPARWVHLSGDHSTLPGPLDPMRGPTGIVWFDGGGHGPVACEPSGRVDCMARPQLWASADAISERVERLLPVDAEAATLTALDGIWWLATSNPTTLWRSTDLERWEEVKLDALVSPGPAEMDWDIRLGEPASAGGNTVIPVSYEARDAGRLLGRPDLGWYVRPEPTAPGSYRIMQITQGDDVDVGQVGIEEIESGLRFSDEANDTIATLDGVRLDFIEAWSDTGAIVDYGVAVVEGMAAMPVKLPGRPVFDHWDNGPTAFGTDTGFHVFKSGADGSIRVWRSTDGRTWTEDRPLGEVDGEPRDAYLYVRPGWGRAPIVGAVSIDDEVQPQLARYWESADGVSWSSTTDLPDTWSPIRIGDRWLSWSDSGEGWRASLDGSTWHPAPALSEVISKSETSGGGSFGPREIIGTTLFYAVDEEEGLRQRDLWMVEFEGALE